MLKTCETCQWWDGDSYNWVCCNEDSDRCADFTTPDDTCESWEELEL